MSIKTFVFACMSFILSAATLTISSIASAQPISLYDQPSQNAKVIGTADLSAGIIPIYTPTDSSSWMKVADPRNGNVGWVKSDDLKTKQGSSNSVTYTQKIISIPNQPGTYQVIQFGNKPNLTDAQMKEYVEKMRAAQQSIQQSFQSIFKDMNDLFQREWNVVNTQYNSPLLMPVPANTQPNQASPNKSVKPQPATGNSSGTQPVK